MDNNSIDIQTFHVSEILFLILLPIFGLVIGLLLLKKPDFLSELEFMGRKPLIFTRRLVQLYGFMFSIISFVFLVAGIVAVINELRT